MRNARRHLDARSLTELGIYVYGLSDPRTGRIFYVGKGGGKLEGRPGNLRVFSHFTETERHLATASVGMSRKCQTIADIWARGDDVAVTFLRRRLRDQDEAFHVEAAVLAALAGAASGDPDNANSGMYLAKHGAVTLDEALLFAAPAVDPPMPCHVLLFNIASSLSQRRTSDPEDVYACTRFAWAGLAPPAPNVIAVGYVAEISRGAFTNPVWRKEPDGRRSFTAPPSDWLAEDHPLMGRSFSAPLRLAPWRKHNGAIGVEFDGAGRFRIFRGAPRAIAGLWHACVEQAAG